MLQPLREIASSPAADMAACRTLLRNGSRTFYAASFLLPRQVREPASALYAFCRLADDLIDQEGGHLAAIRHLRERLDRAYKRRPLAHPADRAFADTVAQFDVPRELPEALLAGLEWDAIGWRYDDLPGLQAYAARVAGAVGAMMAVLMGVRSAELVARACDLGVAMQLTNVARDVGEDARAGRIYLPLAWMREAGLDPAAWLSAPQPGEALQSVIARVLDTADVFYARADAAIPYLPTSCRPGIRAARLLYAEIGHQLRRDGLDSVTRRTVVSPKRKIALLGRALAMSDGTSAVVTEPCLEQTKFLVDAVASGRGVLAPASPLRWWDFYGQAVRVIDLFADLERRERSAEPAREARPFGSIEV